MNGCQLCSNPATFWLQDSSQKSFAFCACCFKYRRGDILSAMSAGGVDVEAKITAPAAEYHCPECGLNRQQLRVRAQHYRSGHFCNLCNGPADPADAGRMMHAYMVANMACKKCSACMLKLRDGSSYACAVCDLQTPQTIYAAASMPSTDNEFTPEIETLATGIYDNHDASHCDRCKSPMFSRPGKTTCAVCTSNPERNEPKTETWRDRPSLL